MELDKHDLWWALTRLPRNLKKIMESPEWSGQVFVGGGYLRAIVAGEKVNDVDVFVPSKDKAKLLAYELAAQKTDVYSTDNAFTVKGKMPIQIIHRWLFDRLEDVSNSFDFTVCCAVIGCQAIPNHLDQELGAEPLTRPVWGSYCDDRFYIDLASKRLIYRNPKRNEDAGGSMLRVLKYYQKGYRIPLDSLGNVMSRMVVAIDGERCNMKSETEVAHVLTGLLREVDPNIDPTHISHLPSLGA